MRPFGPQLWSLGRRPSSPWSATEQFAGEEQFVELGADVIKLLAVCREAERARSRCSHLERAGDPPGVRAQHDHPVGQQHRLLDRVGDEHRVADSSLSDALQLADSSSRLSASRAENGSSISITMGCWMSARHSATRCCMPPDSWCGSRLWKPARPTVSSNSSARRRCCAPVPAEHLGREEDVVQRRAPRQQRGRWNIIATSRRGPGPACRPSNLAARGASSPAIRRSRVDLPHPDRPMTATNCPSWTSR